MNELKELLDDLTTREFALLKLRSSYASWDSVGAARICAKLEGVRLVMEIIRDKLRGGGLVL